MIDRNTLVVFIAIAPYLYLIQIFDDAGQFTQLSEVLHAIRHHRELSVVIETTFDMKGNQLCYYQTQTQSFDTATF